MWRHALVAAVLVCGLIAAASARPQADAGTMAHTLQVGALQREYRLYVPPQAGAGRPLPLVFVFHGGGGVAKRADRLGDFVALARREGFIVVYPQGVGRSWNDGRVTDVTAAHRDRVDDVAFFDAMLAAIARAHPVDRKRVYATGISNGGIFAHYLAAQRSRQVAAIAPVSGGIADPFHRAFQPTDPVSVLVLQGTDDPLVPYDGGAIRLGGGRERGRIIGTGQALALWTRHDGCRSTPAVAALPDRDPDDGCTVTRITWSGCEAGTQVQLLKLQGGGHTWPGGPQYLPERLIGRSCRDVDASEAIWDFFEAHPKP